MKYLLKLALSNCYLWLVHSTVFLYAQGLTERYNSMVQLLHLEPVSDIH